MLPEKGNLRLRKVGAFVIAALAGGVGSPALADVRALYVDPESPRRVASVEVADDGAIRVAMGGGYFLFRDGQTYSVEPGPGGPRVMTLAALAYMSRHAMLETTTGATPDAEPTSPIRYEPAETVTIAGYAGTRYSAAGAEDARMVLSDVPETRPLGAAFKAYFAAVDSMSNRHELARTNILELLAGHGVLKLWDWQLSSVDLAPIDPARFALPATPITEADLALEDDGQPARSREFRRGPSTISALFHDHALLTLTDDGTIRSWAEGSSGEGRPFDTPGPVRAFCKLGSELLLVTGNEDRKGRVALWSGRPGNWKSEASFAETREDPFLALDCSGDEPLLVTGATLRSPRSGTVKALASPALHAFITTLKSGDYLYIGGNAGEWGGGLRRVSLLTGKVEDVDASDPDDLCGGVLNKSCDPVTGLAADPAHPDCILAGIGLVHFASHGQIVRVCGRSIEPVYRKPYTLNPDWETHPTQEDRNPFSSVPFYSMTSALGSVWAVGSDGLYRFGAGARPDFVPFDQLKRRPASGIDWSNPDFVLVSTNMNQRHSLSGSSLILVPKGE